MMMGPLVSLGMSSLSASEDGPIEVALLIDLLRVKGFAEGL